MLRISEVLLPETDQHLSAGRIHRRRERRHPIGCERGSRSTPGIAATCCGWRSYSLPARLMASTRPTG